MTSPSPAFGDNRLPARFWAKVEIAPATNCWLWTARLNNSGYAMVWNGVGMAAAHRFAYVATVGPVPTGLELDHRCRVTRCVNPSHLEAVTHLENIRRAMEVREPIERCINGHPFDERNTYWKRPGAEGKRACRACHRESAKRYQARRRERRPA